MKLIQIISIFLLILSFQGCEDTSGTDETQSQEYDYSSDSGSSDNGNQDGSGYEEDGRGYQTSNSSEDRQSEASDLDTLGLLGDSEGNTTEDTSSNRRFKILGDLNCTINSKTYEQKTALDYKGEALSSGYRYDVVDSSYHIQVVGYSILGDSWDKVNGSLMIKFRMPTLDTTGEFPLSFPISENGTVLISSSTPSINDSYIINGTISNATIQTNAGAMSLSAQFSTVIIPLYK